MSDISLNIWLAGAFAGFTVNCLVYPLDTLKTRIQSPLFHQLYRSQSAVANRALYRGLYQGVGTILLLAIPSSGVFFTTYEGLKYALSSTTIPQPALHAFSSSVACLVNCVIVTPAEVLKQNAQMLGCDRQKKRERVSPTMEVMSQLTKHPAKLWRGYAALAARDLPFTALQFPALEYLRKKLTARQIRRKGEASVNGFFQHAKIAAVSAAVAGSAAAWVTTPVDVVKTRMMLEAGEQGKSEQAVGRVEGGGQKRASVQRGALQIGRDVLQREGMRGLFRGATLRTVWTAFGNGLYMGCYEGAKLYLKDSRRAGRNGTVGSVTGTQTS